MILRAILDNGDDYGYGTPIGENTQDSEFLLSVAEMQAWLPENLRSVTPTSFAISQGAYANTAGQCAYPTDNSEAASSEAAFLCKESFARKLP